ncbi:hypothetical protein GSM42_14800 [Shimazuella sp. KC615]|uniref:LD-carboxypeptidase C-terminal domain-containing protein n=1 Tax=Shimazuella alba TaxID=2690964 RepID=A0A6I4W3T1_9BACL|nr:hypothetical protein [Shimazuella alba]
MILGNFRVVKLRIRNRCCLLSKGKLYEKGYGLYHRLFAKVSYDRKFIENRTFHENRGWTVIQEGEAEGVSIGGNLCTLNLLQGTEYMPFLEGSILFLEDDYLTFPANFDRDLQSLLFLVPLHMQLKKYDGTITVMNLYLNSSTLGKGIRNYVISKKM